MSSPSPKARRQRKASASAQTSEYVDMVVDMLAPAENASIPSNDEEMTSKPRNKQPASSNASPLEKSPKKKKKGKKSVGSSSSKASSSDMGLSGASSSDDDDVPVKKRSGKKKKPKADSNILENSEQEEEMQSQQQQKPLISALASEDGKTKTRTVSFESQHNNRWTKENSQPNPWAVQTDNSEQERQIQQQPPALVPASKDGKTETGTDSFEERHKRWAKENSQPNPFPADASAPTRSKTKSPKRRRPRKTTDKDSADKSASGNDTDDDDKNNRARTPGAQRIGGMGGPTENIPPPTELREQLSQAGSALASVEPSLEMHDSGFSSPTSRMNESGITEFSVEDWNDEPMEKFQNMIEPVAPPPPPVSGQADEEVGSGEFAGVDFAGEDPPEQYEDEPILAQEGVPAPPGLHPNRNFVQHGAFRLSDASHPTRANERRPMLSSVHGDDPSATRSAQHIPDSRNNSQRSLGGAGVLIEARLVTNDEEDLEQNPASRRTRDMPVVEAKMFDEPDDGKCLSRLVKISIVGTILVMVGAGLTILFLFVIADKLGGGDDGSPTGGDQASAIEMFRATLPQSTLLDLDNESSPQARALSWLEGNTAFESQSMERRTQRFALATFFYGTEGDNWEQRDSWLGEESDECNWFSTASQVCPDNGFVYGVLSLEHNKLRGRIPREVSLLTGLTKLRLPGNQLEGPITIEISSLSALKELDLSSNNMSGGLPNDFSRLGDTLEFLSLAGNTQLNGAIPASWGSFARLKVLHLEQTSVSGVVPPEVCALVEEGLVLVVDCDRVFCNCACVCDSGSGGPTPTGSPTLFHPGLQTLHSLLPDYTKEALEDPNSPQSEAFSFMRDDPQLNSYPDFRLIQRFAMATFYYALDGKMWYEKDWVNDGHECAWYSELETNPCVDERLTQLVLVDNGLEFSIPPEIGLLTTLTDLVLTSNHITGEIPTTIGDLTNLLELWLDFNEIDYEIPTELGHLTELILLDIEDNHLTGSIPDELGNLSNLSVLRLHRNELTGEIPDALGNLGDLSVLVLRSNQDLGGEIPESFNNHHSMYYLDLAHMNMTGEISKELFSTWSNASEIDLGGNAFWGELQPEVGQLKSLTWLDLYANEFSGVLPTELGDLVSLETLYLESNNFWGGLPSELGDLPNLILLHVHDNLLSGDVPEEICDRVRNHGLELSVDCEWLICPEDCPCLCGDDDDRRVRRDAESSGGDRGKRLQNQPTRRTQET